MQCYVNTDNLNNVRRTNRDIRNKKREYPKAKISELETQSRILRDLYRGIN